MQRKMKLTLFSLLFLALLTNCSDLNGPSPVEEVATTPKSVRFLALGDSYTIGQSVPEPDRWPNQLAKWLVEQAVQVDSTMIIARTGWRTDNLTAGVNTQMPDSNFNLVGLLIGVNNQYQGRPIAQYEIEFRQLLERSVAQAGGRNPQVFVVSIPHYGFTPFGASDQSNISTEIDAFNAVNKRITDQAGIQYFDITPISRRGLVEPDLVASDGLHPSGKQYRLWVESMQNRIFEMLERE